MSAILKAKARADARARAKAGGNARAAGGRGSARPRKHFPVLEGAAALQRLQDSGCLFFINLTRLHPAGQTLLFVRQGDRIVPRIIDNREQPESSRFTPEEMAEGLAKLKAFAAEMEEVIRLRERRLGYVRQPVPGGEAVRRTRVG